LAVLRTKSGWRSRSTPGNGQRQVPVSCCSTAPPLSDRLTHRSFSRLFLSDSRVDGHGGRVELRSSGLGRQRLVVERDWVQKARLESVFQVVVGRTVALLRVTRIAVHRLLVFAPSVRGRAAARRTEGGTTEEVLEDLEVVLEVTGRTGGRIDRVEVGRGGEGVRLE
jgi:hypothetical protein